MGVGEWLKAILYGIAEGVTEWLPVSSTGHLILMEEWIPFRFTEDGIFLSEFTELFEVIVQLGAILAVVLLFRHRLFPFGKGTACEEKREILRLWCRVLVSGIPAGIFGIVVDRMLERATGKDLDGWLYRPSVVAAALIVYGFAFLWVERKGKRTREVRIPSVTRIPLSAALGVGAFQALSLVPGTSRSGSTILGALLLGFSRPAAAEFSFLMAVPVMFGASGVKLLGFASYLRESGQTVPRGAWGLLAVGFAAAFAVSVIALRFLTDFVRRHRFSGFGVYRILLGIAVLILFGIKKG